MHYLLTIILLLLSTPCLAGLHISVEPTQGVTYYRVGGPDYKCLEGGIKAPARPDGSLLLDVDCTEAIRPESPITIRGCNDAGCGPHVTLDGSNQVPGPPKGVVIHQSVIGK